MNKILLTTILITAVLASCKNDELANLSPDNNEVKLTAKVNTLTKATATSFETNDSIGLYAMAWTDATPSVQTRLAAPYYAENVRFGWNENGFIPQSAPVYWPVKTRKLDLYAYFPYSADGISEDNTLNASIQTDQSIAGNYSKSDYMTARLTGNERTKETLTLPFRHALSKVRFTLVPGDGYTAEELGKLKLILKQLKTTVKINLSKTNEEEDYLTGAGTPKDVTVSATKEAIIVPQTKTAGDALFTLTNASGATVVTYKAENGKNTFETGKQYNYTVKVSRVGVNLKAEITDWEVVEFTESSIGQVIDLTTDIGGTEGTKNETWSENDVIGLFQKNGEVMAEMNQQFIWKDGKLSSSKNLFWPDNGTNVTLYAYYPYTAGLNSTSLAAKVDKDQQTTATLNNSDVKTAVLTTDKSTSGKVTLTFKHAFSKITVNLVKGTGFTQEEIAGMKITLPEMKTTAAIDLTKSAGEDQYILNVGDEQNIIPFNGPASQIAIVVPQTKTVGSDLFSIKTATGVPVVNYKAENGRNVFESGKQYTFSIKLNRVGMNVNAEIENWEVTSFVSDAYQAMDITGNIGGVEGEKDETFAPNDKIGVYIRFNEEFTHSNLAYTWETSGLNGEKTVYWPDRGTTVDLYAYYPYKSTGAGSTLLKTELPGDQTSDQAYSDSDVKTAQWTGITQYTNGQVILPFIHAFSRIRVNLVAGTGFTTADLEGCTVQIEDMYKEVVIDICKQPGDEGYLNNQTGSQTIKMHAGKGAIIIPRTVTAGNVLFTILDKEGNKMAIGKAATDKNTFLSNNQYDITLTLKKAGINVSADITNWKVNNIDMDGEQWLN